MIVVRQVARCFTSLAFAGMGALHLIRAPMFARIVPPFFPHPLLLVYISGVCEIAGGVGLQIPSLRRPAGWGLIGLLLAVFPANIYMAVDPDRFADLHVPLWALWLRLPMQALFVWDVWWVGIVTPPG